MNNRSSACFVHGSLSSYVKECTLLCSQNLQYLDVTPPTSSRRQVSVGGGTTNRARICRLWEGGGLAKTQSEKDKSGWVNA